MAAILCKGIGNIFEFICTTPCKLCEIGCRGACGSPLSAFVIVTVILQSPIVILSAMELGGAFGNNGSCKGSDWLVGMFLVSLVHILVSFYLSYRVTNGTDITLRDNNRHSSYERISYLLCHDPIIALYILVWIFFVSWLIVGSYWSTTNVMKDGDNVRCGNEIETNVGIVLGLGWTFLLLGPTVLSCVLCCACFSKRDYVASDAEFEAKANANNANYNNNNNNNNNNSNDIELANTSSTPALNTQTHSESKTKESSNNKNPSELSSSMQYNSKHSSTQYVNTPPRTYSVDGIPIDELSDNNNNNRKSYVAKQQQQQQQKDPNNNSNNTIPEVVAEEIPPPMLPPATAPRTNNTTTTAAAETSANAVVNSVTKKVGGWLKGGNKKEGADVKATVY